ncbi:MAG: phosphoribosylamine--glycine ligase [Candidatus Thermoplasmatota archaeon]|nr:phosphoribosylamine--glycine ligase [Candidatus Thermoplasmatota archaeon]
MKILVIGGGAREHAICKAVSRSDADLYAIMKNSNPGIKKLARDFCLQNETNVDKVLSYARSKKIDLAIVGPEAPEEAGVTNTLEADGIKVASPTREAAEIETNKEFMRNLMEKYGIKGMLKSRAFSDAKGAKEFIEMLDGEVAIKPVGLTGGKGVRIAGDHFRSIEDAIGYAEDVISKKIGGKARVLIEEKAVGEEFTLQTFCDSFTIVPTPAVQDHKRLLPGDRGPNTGGMGSYSDASGILPFMDRNDYEEAVAILQRIIDAMHSEGRPYRGAIYGQFMLTNEGPKVIEINARWGDPEAMNILPLLRTDFVDITMAMVEGTLSRKKMDLEKKSTVCKYVVPEGYGVNSLDGKKISVDEDRIKKSGGQLFYASVDERDGNVYTTKSRSLAVVGIADKIDDAEVICEDCLKHVKGEHVFIRHDIGKRELIQKRIEHMRMLRG